MQRTPQALSEAIKVIFSMNFGVRWWGLEHLQHPPRKGNLHFVPRWVLVILECESSLNLNPASN